MGVIVVFSLICNELRVLVIQHFSLVNPLYFREKSNKKRTDESNLLKRGIKKANDQLICLPVKMQKVAGF